MCSTVRCGGGRGRDEVCPEDRAAAGPDGQRQEQAAVREGDPPLHEDGGRAQQADQPRRLHQVLTSICDSITCNI